MSQPSTANGGYSDWEGAILVLSDRDVKVGSAAMAAEEVRA